MNAALILIAISIFLLALQYIPTKDWEGIVVHHSGSRFDTLDSIREYHMTPESEGGPKGGPWIDCGYHYVIEKDGTIKKGRPITWVGAHARTGKPYNRNDTHIGICLCGDKHFNLEQLVALSNLCRKLVDRYSIESIERHHEECPGSVVDVESLEEVVLETHLSRR